MAPLVSFVYFRFGVRLLERSVFSAASRRVFDVIFLFYPICVDALKRRRDFSHFEVDGAPRRFSRFSFGERRRSFPARGAVKFEKDLKFVLARRLFAIF